jgi:hypothetical protein
LDEVLPLIVVSVRKIYIEKEDPGRPDRKPYYAVWFNSQCPYPDLEVFRRELRRFLGHSTVKIGPLRFDPLKGHLEATHIRWTFSRSMLDRLHQEVRKHV